MNGPLPAKVPEWFEAECSSHRKFVTIPDNHEGVKCGCGWTSSWGIIRDVAEAVFHCEGCAAVLAEHPGGKCLYSPDRFQVRYDPMPDAIDANPHVMQCVQELGHILRERARYSGDVIVLVSLVRKKGRHWIFQGRILTPDGRVHRFDDLALVCRDGDWKDIPALLDRAAEDALSFASGGSESFSRKAQEAVGDRALHSPETARDCAYGYVGESFIVFRSTADQDRYLAEEESS